MLFQSCKQVRAFADKVFNTSPRKKYERKFSGDSSELLAWKIQFDSAKANQLKIQDGFVSLSNFSNNNHALGYAINLKQGERFIVDVESDSEEAQFFIDFFQYLADGTLNKKQFWAKQGERHFSIDVQESGAFKVVVQPEVGFVGDFMTKIYTQPTLSFPVEGKDNRAIQSFWGAPRGGGARKHEGVDIFAAKGTNLLAAADGFVFRTGNTGLGGKQVWIKDGVFGHSLYYAHLDSIIAKKGQRVKIGDVVGTVGNTGNARTTPPHLHFGIYDGGSAVDPYPFIKIRKAPVMKKANYKRSQLTTGSANLRNSPSTKSTVLTTLPKQQAVKVLSKTGQWYHIVSGAQEGFVHESLVK